MFSPHPEIPSRKLIPAVNSDLHLCSRVAKGIARRNRDFRGNPSGRLHRISQHATITYTLILRLDCAALVEANGSNRKREHAYTHLSRPSNSILLYARILYFRNDAFIVWRKTLFWNVKASLAAISILQISKSIFDIIKLSFYKNFYVYTFKITINISSLIDI